MSNMKDDAIKPAAESKPANENEKTEPVKTAEHEHHGAQS